MGKKDIALLRYFEDEDRYADLINGFVFSGTQVVSGSDILEKNAAIRGEIRRQVREISDNRWKYVPARNEPGGHRRHL